MTPKHLISTLAALLVLAACVCAVSASTFRVNDVSLANFNEQKDIALSLDSAPAGVSGYYVTFTIDPPIAKIVGVTYPADWIDPMFVTNSAGPNNPFNVFMKVADVKNGIRASPATDIYLGSVTVQGVSPGTAHITVHANQVDDDDGDAITLSEGTGSITVATPPGSIQVTSNPPGAEIYVNDVDTTLTTMPPNNIVTNLVPGYYSVKVTYPGRVDGVQPAVLVNSGETTPVNFDLVQAGTASVTSVPPGASILIDGVLQQDVITNHDFTNIVPGPHTIQVNLKDYYPKSLKKTVYASKTTVYPFTLTRIPPNEIEVGPPWGKIDVASDPPGAQVYIDGVAVDGMETPGWTNIEAKSHTVYVTLDTYLTPDPITVDVIKGSTYYLNFPLQKAPSVSQSCLWPPNNKLVDMTLTSIKDPDGNPVTLTITRITSDEPTVTDKESGGAKNTPDAIIKTGAAFQLRAERAGAGNGRVYNVFFTATNSRTGAVSTGYVTVCVPHDQSTKSNTCSCNNDGQKYDATK